MMLMSTFITPLRAIASPEQQAEEMPDMALLEYLAELVEVDGELVGPMDMVDKLEKDKNERQDPAQPNEASNDKAIKREDKEHD